MQYDFSANIRELKTAERKQPMAEGRNSGLLAEKKIAQPLGVPSASVFAHANE